MRTHLLFVLLLPVLALCACAPKAGRSVVMTHAVTTPAVQSCGFTSDDPIVEREHQLRHAAISRMHGLLSAGEY